MERGRPSLSLVGLVPAAAFWLLDAFYLRRERAFRDLYDALRLEQLAEYSMEAERVSTRSYTRALLSVRLVIFYGALAGAGLLLAAVLAR